MKDQRELYDRIDAYLNGQMTREEQSAFAKAIKKDSELADVVALHRDLHQMLGDQPVNTLRKNLTQLEAREYPDSNNSNWWKIAALVVAVMIAGIWWMLPVTSDLPPSNNSPAGVSTEQAIESLPSIPVEEIDNNQIVPTESPVQEEEQPKPQRNPPKTSLEKPQPIVATDFTPNPNLEFFIANNYRSDIAIQLSARPPAKSTALLFQFKLAGEIKTSHSELGGLQIHLFSNDPLSFTEFQPLLSLPVELNEDTNDKNIFSIDKLIELKAGLYYYLIENATTEEVLLVDKFAIDPY